MHPESDICQQCHVHEPSKFGIDGDPFPSLLVPVTTTVMNDEESQDEDGLNLCSQVPFTQLDAGIMSKAQMTPEADSV